MKKNNKGFSLVELIIVIAIMAILAGAIAPALIRYIDKSRRSNDVKACKTIDTSMSTALGNEKIYELLVTNGSIITIDPAKTMTEVTMPTLTPGTHTISVATAGMAIKTPTGATWDDGVDCNYAAALLYNELSKSFSGKSPKINFKKAVKGSAKPDCYVVVIDTSGKVSVLICNKTTIASKSIADLSTTVLDAEGTYTILPECCDSYN